MKKISILLLVALTLAACQKNETPALVPDTITAQIEQETAPTKTYMDANNNIRWSEGDQIVGFMKSSLGLKYQILPSSVGKTSAFFEKVSGGNDYIGAGTEWDHNIVYYPYSEAAEAAKSVDNYVLNVVLPSEQDYAAGSFGKGTMAMVAVSEDSDIIFRNVLGGMKLQLKGTQKVKSITLQGKNNEKLSGAATVTAYTDETKPAITMASGASTSVTLNCGNGVQLNESTATEFIISLPPVLFSNGFTVTVTDTESNTYTVETDKANTVLRSSLLVMPAFKLGEAPDQSEPDNAVDMIFFDFDNLTVVPGLSYTLTVDFEPYNATDKTLVWNSSNPAVASVVADGTVTALSDGSATITAVAVGGATATCEVTVKSCVSATVDYEVDGINYGKGVRIGTTVWAPVNCGYHKTDYPYGKLYQWGRKYGQGYDDYYTSDASYPSADNLVEGPVTPSVGQAEDNKDKFYTSSSGDWCKVQDDQMWNSGTESSPIKTAYDPCPEGWRVPTYAELNQLRRNRSSWTTSESRKGYYFSGEYTTIDGNPQMFFSAGGYRYDDGHASHRDYYVGYWSSKPRTNYDAYRLYFGDGSVNMNSDDRARGYYVRCVQVID